MYRVEVLACAAALTFMGCQWVLPIYESPGDGGGVSEAGAASDGASDGANIPDSTGMEAAGSDAGTCNAMYTGNPACDGCLNQMCCASFNQCFVVNSECLALQVCIQNCAPFDFTCPQNCASSHPAGVNDYAAAVDCSKRCNGECMGAADAGSDAGAQAGDLCDPSMETKCPGGVLDCVPPPDPFSSTCRLPCQSFATCSNSGLVSNSCCLLPNPMINVCIPNQEVPDGSTCN